MQNFFVSFKSLSFFFSCVFFSFLFFFSFAFLFVSFVSFCFFFFPFWAAALKGSMTYAFTHMGDFLLLLLLLLLLLRTPPPPVSRPISQPGGPYPSLEAQIPDLRLSLAAQNVSQKPLSDLHALFKDATPLTI